MRALGRQGVFVPLMGLLVILAWISLWLWELSPYGRYLHHGQWTALGLGGRVCLAPGTAASLGPALPYVGGWVLMTSAMMAAS